MHNLNNHIKYNLFKFVELNSEQLFKSYLGHLTHKKRDVLKKTERIMKYTISIIFLSTIRIQFLAYFSFLDHQII